VVHSVSLIGCLINRVGGLALLQIQQLEMKPANCNLQPRHGREKGMGEGEEDEDEDVCDWSICVCLQSPYYPH
jgi:hypothetical protein